LKCNNKNKRNRRRKVSQKESKKYIFNENYKNDNNVLIQQNISEPPKKVRRKIKINSSINNNSNSLSSNIL